MTDKKSREERKRQREIARLIAQKDIPEKRNLGRLIGEKLRRQRVATRDAMKQDLLQPI